MFLLKIKMLVLKILLIGGLAVLILFMYYALNHDIIVIEESNSTKIVLTTWAILLYAQYGTKIVFKNFIFGFEKLEKNPIMLNKNNYNKLLCGVILDDSDIKEKNFKNTKNSYIYSMSRFVGRFCFPFAIAIILTYMGRGFTTITATLPIIEVAKPQANGLGGCHNYLCIIFSNVFFSKLIAPLLSKMYNPKTFVGPYSYAFTENTILMPKWAPIHLPEFADITFVGEEYMIITMRHIPGGVINKTLCKSRTGPYPVEYLSKISEFQPTYGRQKHSSINLDRTYYLNTTSNIVDLYTYMYEDTNITGNATENIEKRSVQCNFTLEKGYMNAIWLYNASGLTLQKASLYFDKIEKNDSKWVDNYDSEVNRLRLTIENSLKYQIQGAFNNESLFKNDQEKLDVFEGALLAYAQTVLLRSSTDEDILNRVTDTSFGIQVQHYKQKFVLQSYIFKVVLFLIVFIFVGGVYRWYRAGNIKNIGEFVKQKSNKEERKEKYSETLLELQKNKDFVLHQETEFKEFVLRLSDDNRQAYDSLKQKERDELRSFFGNLDRLQQYDTEKQNEQNELRHVLAQHQNTVNDERLLRIKEKNSNYCRNILLQNRNSDITKYNKLQKKHRLSQEKFLLQRMDLDTFNNFLRDQETQINTFVLQQIQPNNDYFEDFMLQQIRNKNDEIARRNWI